MFHFTVTKQTSKLLLNPLGSNLTSDFNSVKMNMIFAASRKKYDVKWKFTWRLVN